MPEPLLLTKLYFPPPRPRIILRPRLIERLNAGLHSKLTLVSAPAGFGKTTLVSDWAAGCGHKVAWVSLDEGDGDSARFLAYLVTALQTLAPQVGAGLLAALQSPQPPSSESILTTLLNEIAVIPDQFILVLDDYHAVDSRPVDQALAFLLDHLPQQMHLVIATREDPSLPLARLRARGQLTELRAADLRFTPAEAAEFFNQGMGLNLSAEDVAALEARTEGWIAGLQLAALSMQGYPDARGIIQSFSASHHFVLDYLIEEVLQKQSEGIQLFLLRTSILDRMCGPLCDYVLETQTSQPILDYLERSNLFLVPLDSERLWYRYHHLFGELLRKRLGQSLAPDEIAGLHVRASEWYEHKGLALEAFHHAALANDVDRAERLIGSKDMGLHFRSVIMTILGWLASLPKTVLDAKPRLWVRSATLALMAGQTTGVEENLQAAEAAIAAQTTMLDSGPDEQTRDMIGQIACARATLALTHYDPAEMIVQARRALEYLHPNDLPFLFTANWALATASLFQGDRTAAALACRDSISISQKSGDVFSTILSTTDMGQIQELDTRLHLAAESYRRVLQLCGEHPQPNAEEAHLGLARIYCEWNELDAAEQHAQQSLQLARQYDRAIDRYIVSEVFLARLKLARGDVNGATAMLAQTQQTAQEKNFILRLPEIAAAQVLTLIRQDQVAAAAQLAGQHEIPLSRAHVLIAQGDPAAALAVLELLRQQMEARGWADERLKTMVLQAVALHLCGERDAAAQVLDEALALAEPEGFIRIFVDEGAPMAELLAAAAARGARPGYVRKLLAAIEAEAKSERTISSATGPSLLVEPLSPRELEVLGLIAQGLSNQEIGQRLYLALDTVKGHNRRIFEKLQVQRRTEAIARARELGLL